MKRLLISSLVLLSGLSAVPAFAAAPDAGQLLREQQPQRQMPQQLPRLEAEQERPAMVESGLRIMVKGFSFSGYEGLVGERDLQLLVADTLGKELAFGELQGVAAKVTEWLKGKGWFLARAYLPKQDVTSGVIEIAIIQGKSDGGITIKGDSSVRIREEKLQAIAQGAISSGAALNEKNLERAVLLMNDLAGVSAKASLAPGAAPGSTGIAVDVSEGSLYAGALWGDNQGNRYTGAWRGNGMLNLNDPFRYGDQFSLLLTGAEGLYQGRAAYAFPLTATGLKGNVSYTGMTYKLIGDMSALQADGQSHAFNAGVSYPLLRSRTANVTTSFVYEFKSLTDTAVGVDIRSKKLHSGAMGLTGDRYDTLLGGGFITWNAGATAGNFHDAVADTGITSTGRNYTRFNFGLARLQRLADQLSLNLSWSAQLALDNLDSSEKFNLGGPNGVRAYPTGEGSGDEGSLINVDLRYDLPLPAVYGSLQLSSFFDTGCITLHKETWQNSIVTATNNNTYWLQGAGLGLTYAYAGKYTLKISWANTLGDNPGRSVTDKDADGRSDTSRVWLQGLMYF